MPNLIDWTFKSGHSKKEEFALCLGNDGGFLSIGGPTSKKHLLRTSRCDGWSVADNLH